MSKVNTDDNLITLLDYDSGTNPIYIGYATSGTATSSAKWKIIKLTYDVNDNILTKKWAGGSSVIMNQVWDNRTSLVYS